MTRTELAAALMARGQQAVPLLSAREMLHADRRDHLVLTRHDADGENWPLLASPLGLRDTPPRVLRPVPPLDSNSAEIRAQLGMSPRNTSS